MEIDFYHSNTLVCLVGIRGKTCLAGSEDCAFMWYAVWNCGLGRVVCCEAKGQSLQIPILNAGRKRIHQHLASSGRHWCVVHQEQNFEFHVACSIKYT